MYTIANNKGNILSKPLANFNFDLDLLCKEFNLVAQELFNPPLLDNIVQLNYQAKEEFYPTFHLIGKNTTLTIEQKQYNNSNLIINIIDRALIDTLQFDSTYVITYSNNTNSYNLIIEYSKKNLHGCLKMFFIQNTRR